MIAKRHILASALLVALFLGTGPHGEPGGVPSWAAEKETLRPEVGRPLQAAQDLLKAQKYKEALAKVREADAVDNKTAYESFIIERMRGSAAVAAGENDVAIKAFEAVINSGRLPAAEQIKMIEAVVGSYYRAKDYPKVITWGQRYLKEGGNNPQMHTLVVQSLYLSGDYAGAAKEIGAELARDEKDGKTPAEDQLQILANCYLKLKDFAGYAATLERLVSHYPKKEYWADLISRTARKPGFSDRLSLDVFRLQHATGNLRDAADYMNMTQLALQAGLPAEAKNVVNEAFGKNILGNGSDADRHKRLRDLANKQASDDLKAMPQTEAQAKAAKDGNAAINLGYAYVTAGQYEKGIPLMEQGIEKGGLRHLEDAKLHLGLAYLESGNKAKAARVLKSVQGADGVTDLARLWLIQAK